MMTRSELRLVHQLQSDLETLTQRAGENSAVIAQQSAEIARLRATLSYIDEVLSQHRDDPTIQRTHIFIQCALHSQEAQHGV